jgi:outer membrane protein assembly factor BamA
VGFFVDVGNVFSTEGVVFRNGAGQPLDYSFDPSQLRLSAGVAVRVLIPLGELQLSYGVPLNADVSGAGPYPPDQIDRFQIAFGVDY